MKKIKEDKVKFVHSQTIKLKASTPLIPIELDFGSNGTPDIKKFLIERMGSNSIRFVMPIPEEDFEKQKKDVEKKLEAIDKAQTMINDANQIAKKDLTVGDC